MNNYKNNANNEKKMLNNIKLRKLKKKSEDEDFKEEESYGRWLLSIIFF
jgi:hypothetical protein